MSKKQRDKVVNITCNPDGRPGYGEAVKSKCRECWSEPGDCMDSKCPLYAFSPKNKHKDKVAASDFSWLVRDEFTHGRREQVNLVNRKTGEPVVLKTIYRKDYYPDEY